MVLGGERLVSGPRGEHAARALLNVAGRLGLAGGRAGAGLLESRRRTNGRGLREAGVLPDAGPGFADAPGAGRDAAGIAAGLADGDLDRALPAARRPAPRPARAATPWDARARAGDDGRRPRELPHRGPARARRPSCSRPRPTPRRRARSSTPTAACSACARRSATRASVRAEWQVLADLAPRLGHDLGVPQRPDAVTRQLSRRCRSTPG